MYIYKVTKQIGQDEKSSLYFSSMKKSVSYLLTRGTMFTGEGMDKQLTIHNYSDYIDTDADIPLYYHLFVASLNEDRTYYSITRHIVD